LLLETKVQLIVSNPVIEIKIAIKPFFHLLLVNLLLLASLDKRSTHRELDYFLTAENNKLEVLESKYLADEAFVNY